MVFLRQKLVAFTEDLPNLHPFLPTPTNHQKTSKTRCLATHPDGTTAQGELKIEVGIRTDDVVMVGWINGDGVTISSTDVNPQIVADLPPDGGPNPNPAGAARVVALAANDDHFDYDPTNAASVYTGLDRDYLLGWLFKFANNPDPDKALKALGTPDATDPTGSSTTGDFTAHAGYMDYAKYGAYTLEDQDYKLVNHFQVKYRVNPADPTQFIGDPIVLQSGGIVGATVNPTGVPPDFIEQVLDWSSLNLAPPYNWLATLAATLAHALLQPQYGPANGVIGKDLGNTRISHINDGSPDIFAIRAFNTLEGLDVPNPVFWENIGSKITFKCGDTFPTPKRQNYPTYYRYDNGVLTVVYLQDKSPKGHFFPDPYPFGTLPSYGLPPTPPDSIPLIPGGLMFPTINGGRNGIATLPAEDSARVPEYTVP